MLLFLVLVIFLLYLKRHLITFHMQLKVIKIGLLYIKLHMFKVLEVKIGAKILVQVYRSY